jgi:hypothetical protein
VLLLRATCNQEKKKKKIKHKPKTKPKKRTEKKANLAINKITKPELTKKKIIIYVETDAEQKVSSM